MFPTLAILAGVLSPRFEAYLPGILGLIGVASLIFLDRKKPHIWKAGYVITLCLLALAAIGSLWAIDGGFALERTGKLALVLLPGLLLPSLILSDLRPAPEKVFFAALAVPVFLGTVFILSEWFFNFPAYRLTHLNIADDLVNFNFYNRSTMIVFLFGLTALLTLFFLEMERRQKGICLLALAAPLLALFFVTYSQTAQLALIVGLVVFAAFPVRCKWSWRALTLTIALALLSAPWAVLQIAPHIQAAPPESLLQQASVPQRVEIWAFAAAETLKHPWLGQGIEAMRFLETDDSLATHVLSTHILHPHNGVFQIWVEFGLLGILLLIGALAFLLRKIQSLPPLASRTSLGVLAAVMSVSATGYGLWQSWLMGTFILTTSIALMAINALRNREV